MPDTFLAQLESLTPGRVMQLAGSLQAFLAGVDLYQQEAVTFQGWSQDKTAALFHFKDRGVQLIDGGSITNLRWDCELCGSTETPCSHVIAILASMAHAWKRQVSFAAPEANADYFENLRGQLLGESGEADKSEEWPQPHNHN